MEFFFHTPFTPARCLGSRSEKRIGNFYVFCFVKLPLIQVSKLSRSDRHRHHDNRSRRTFSRFGLAGIVLLLLFLCKQMLLFSCIIRAGIQFINSGSPSSSEEEFWTLQMKLFLFLYGTLLHPNLTHAMDGGSADDTYFTVFSVMRNTQ